MARPKTGITLEQRFWSRVKLNHWRKCWKWIGYRDKNGYGSIGSGKHTHLLAHRISWQFRYGPVPNGLFVLHKCDNPSCVNPHHLFLGTQADNNRDRDMKGRGYSPPGEACHLSKFKEADIKLIRHLRKDGVSEAIVAAAFGTTKSNIYMIMKRQTWKHI